MKVIRAEDVILCNEIRICDTCKEETMWARPRQSKKGYCLHHALLAEPEPEPSLPEALRTVVRAFPTTSVTEADPTPRYAPDLYVDHRVKVVDASRWLVSGKPYWRADTARPLDAGPCERCRRIVRRYGPEGYPYCTECEPVS